MPERRIDLAVRLTFCLPLMPNFIRCEGTDLAFPVGRLTAEQVNEFAGTWTDAFVAHCREKRVAFTPPTP